ncbi:MAG: hypothetical protein JF595_17245, partial [Sphingomonadales bacterium]|nr:hypothetical protein [Sphingomonadales bacterium]
MNIELDAALGSDPPQFVRLTFKQRAEIDPLAGLAPRGVDLRRKIEVVDCRQKQARLADNLGGTVTI